ncbi:CYTH domain-containing protein, partial [Arthrobacter sp. Br18]|uniref:CYTH domain-containing protein n=1 Tax=Arthrobacter sp. Br18 TaxID=1312954 RepID=UPI0012DD5475
MSVPAVPGIVLKFDVDDTALLPPLADLAGIDSVDEPVDSKLRAEYFDTQDLRLASRGITLGRRIGGNTAGWHLTVPGAADERKEYREPLERTTKVIPEPLLRLIRVHTRNEALTPVARLTTQRTVHRLRGMNGEVLADFSDDQVHVQTLFSDQGTHSWREWGIERVDGSPDLLKAGQHLLATRGISPAGGGSRLVRALGPHLHSVPAARPTPARPPR